MRPSRMIERRGGVVFAIGAGIDFFPAAGLLLPFGYGQGTGQAMNYGMQYDIFYGNTDGTIKSIGLTIAATGFLVASFGGVIHLNILKRRGKFVKNEEFEEVIDMNEMTSGMRDPESAKEAE